MMHGKHTFRWDLNTDDNIPRVSEREAEMQRNVENHPRFIQKMEIFSSQLSSNNIPRVNVETKNWFQRYASLQ